MVADIQMKCTDTVPSNTLVRGWLNFQLMFMRRVEHNIILFGSSNVHALCAHDTIGAHSWLYNYALKLTQMCLRYNSEKCP